MIPFLIATVAVLAQQPTQQSTSTIARLVVTPATRTMSPGDTLQLQARPLDAQGRVVPEARVRFVQSAGNFEGSVDSTGRVIAGSVGSLAVTAVANVGATEKPAIERIVISIVPSRAARITLAPDSARLLVGQRILVEARVFSKENDLRNDRITWRSSAPGVVQSGAGGTIMALAPGRATLTASAGAASGTMNVEVLSNDEVTITLSPSVIQARTGDVITFRPNVRDKAGKVIPGLTPTWMISPGQGEVGPDGNFVGYEPGTYVVSAGFGPLSASATVTLTPRDVRRSATVVGRLPRTAFPTSEVWLHPSGKVAYLGTHLGGDRVYAIDVSNPASPVVVDSIIVNARVINDMMTTPDGDYMVITREGADNRKNGIVIADTRDPLHPKALSEFTDGVTAGVHSAFIHKQAKYGTHIYLTNDGTGALHIIDINDPAHPKQAAVWKTARADAGRSLHDIDVQNGLVYASYWNDGLVILDVGNGIKGGTPSNPKLVTQYKYDLSSLYRDVEKEGGPGFIRGTHTAWRHGQYVFVADEVFGNDAEKELFEGRVARAHGRLQVLDVTDIEHPKSVAWYEPEYGGVHNVWVLGDTLYMGAYNAGFRAFDISGQLKGDLRAQGREIAHVNPAAPDAKIPNAAFTWGVVVNPKDGLAYVNDFNSGLWIVRLDPKPKIVP